MVGSKDLDFTNKIRILEERVAFADQQAKILKQDHKEEIEKLNKRKVFSEEQ